MKLGINTYQLTSNTIPVGPGASENTLLFAITANHGQNCPCSPQNPFFAWPRLRSPAGPRVCPAETAHGRPEAPNCLGRPKLAWLLGFWAFALRFCLCKAQNQVMAGAWLCKPAGPRVCPAEAAYRQPGAPGRLGRPKLAWLLGFWAIALRFCCAGPKTGLWPKLGPARQPGHVCSVQGLPIGG